MIKVEMVMGGLFASRMRAIRDATRADSTLSVEMRKDLKATAEFDHTRMVLRSIDRFGLPRAPLAESTLKDKKRGPDPRSLIPRGLASRFIANARFTWVTIRDELNELVGSFVNIVDKHGRSFARYHLDGTPRLPRRDVGGISPEGRREITARFRKFRDEVARAGR